MNPQEREQLTRFLQQLTQAPAVQKDGEADALIREACARQPDAAYLLVQRALLLDHAVRDAQAQVARLQSELEQRRAGSGGGGGFLDPNAWGNSAGTRPVPPQAMPYAAPIAPAAAPAPSAWGSGMLGNIATTAAGVVAGGFLFQGIEHLLGQHGGAHDSKDSPVGNPGTTNGLSGDLPAEHHDALPANNAGVFDTSSVDDFIAGESDAGDSADDIV